MKKLLLITLILLPFYGMSQTKKPVDSFLGIKLGSSKADVIAEMKTKGYSLSESTSKMLIFMDVKLGSFASEYLAVLLVDDKAAGALFSFKSELDTKVLDLYSSLASNITASYGAGYVNNKLSAVYDGTDISGSEYLLIKSGDAEYRTIWTSDNKNFISLIIGTDLKVLLTYRDKALSEVEQKRQADKDKAEF